MSVDMNRTIAEASLDNLHDIMVPDPIGFFPLAPGWAILFLLLLTLLFHFVWQKYLTYKREQYRRDALEELSTLKKNNADQMLALLSLAKRIGITVYGRENIAKLHDDAWWDFMQIHSKTKVEFDLRESIKYFLYSEKSLDDSEYLSLFILIETWIKTHKGLSNV